MIGGSPPAPEAPRPNGHRAPLDEALSALAAALWGAFPKPHDIEQAVTFAGLAPERIHFAQASATAWRDVLLVARRRRQLAALLDHVVAERPDVPELAEVAALVRRSLPSDDAGGVLETGASPPPARPAPSQLLDARHEVIPWHARGRSDDLAELDAWADSAESSSAWLLHAEGGVGKTRLAIEWARRRRAAGWCAGFLPKHPHAEWADDLCAWGVPVLVVVDYAESRPDLTALLTVLRAAHATGAGLRLRVLLLARNDGDWFATLRTHRELGAWLSARPPRELGPVAVKAADRAEVFAEAAVVFAAVREKATVVQVPVAFDDERFGRVLYLHMAALAAVERLPFDAGSLMDAILDHEEQFWERRAREDDDLDVSAHRELARQLVAAATLRGSLTSKDEAREMLKRLADRALDRDDDKLIALMHRVYQRGEGVWQPGLEPDLIGEAMVVRVARPPPGRGTRAPPGWIDHVFPEDEAGPLRVGFTVLGRASATAPEATVPWMERMLAAGSLEVRAPVALEAAKVVGKRTAFSALGKALAEALDARGDAALVEALERVGVPEHTVSLREVAAWIDHTAYRSLGEDDAALVERAGRANNLGISLSELGQWEEALAATREAVANYRTLAAHSPDAFLPDLALSLSNLGLRLSEFGQRAEALTALREAVANFRTLAARNPDAFLPYLAGSLSNLGIGLSELGQWKEALAATREAVANYRMLAALGSGAFLLNLATSLNNLGNRLSERGQREEALVATREAVANYRTLAERNPDAFLPYLAGSRINLGRDLSALGQLEEALAAVAESFDLYWCFFERLPAAFAQNTGIAMRQLLKLHEALGRPLPTALQARVAVFDQLLRATSPPR